jgi:hypothetical protein
MPFGATPATPATQQAYRQDIFPPRDRHLVGNSDIRQTDLEHVPLEMLLFIGYNY